MSMKRKKNKQKFEYEKKRFLCYCSLVSCGIRDAYLVDNCDLSVEEISSILSMTDSDGKILMLVFDFNIIIISKFNLERKLDRSVYDPLIVDISEKIPVIVQNDDVYEKIYCFMNNLIKESQLYENKLIHNVNIVDPCMIGWLLGYPSLYHMSCEALYSNFDSLSGQNLKKFSIILGEIDIMEFSIPVCLISDTIESKIISMIQSRRNIVAQTLLKHPVLLCMNSFLPHDIQTLSEEFISTKLVF